MTNLQLENIVRQYDTIVVWGNNPVGKYIIGNMVSGLKDRTVILCDNDRKKQNAVDGIVVISSKEAEELYANALWILTSKSFESVMREELYISGIAENQIVLGITDEIQEYLVKERAREKRTPLSKIQFEIDIVEHCNLDCNCCSQFAAIAEPGFIDLDELKQDLLRLSLLFGGEAERIYLIGGEPLLHPELDRCMEIARAAFPIGKISVFTNGLLLKKMGESFWNSCRQNDIGIIVTKYPIEMDYVALEGYVRERGVSFELFGASNDFKYMENLGLDITGKQSAEDSFTRCVEANNCIKLKRGRLYTCTRPAAIYKFNKYFNLNLEVNERDYIDIYKAKTAEEILDFLCKSIPFCRYCNKNGDLVSRKWGHSSKNIEEWT